MEQRFTLSLSLVILLYVRSLVSCPLGRTSHWSCCLHSHWSAMSQGSETKGSYISPSAWPDLALQRCSLISIFQNLNEELTIRPSLWKDCTLELTSCIFLWFCCRKSDEAWNRSLYWNGGRIQRRFNHWRTGRRCLRNWIPNMQPLHQSWHYTRWVVAIEPCYPEHLRNVRQDVRNSTEEK